MERAARYLLETTRERIAVQRAGSERAQDAPEVRLQILSRPGARDGRRTSEYYECRDLR